MKRIGSAVGEYIRLTDRWLLAFWLLASALAIVFQQGLYQAGMISASRGNREVKMMLWATLIGLVVAIFVSLIDYEILLRLWKFYVPVCVFLVVLTRFVGTVVGDNQAWLSIRFGGFGISIQPSEFLKICFIITFSMHLSKVRDRLHNLPTLFRVCVHGIVPALLIEFLQGDTGSALVFVGIFLVMLFCAGIQWRYILIALGTVAAAFPLLWYGFFSKDQQMRILILFNPELNPDYAFQQNRSLKALAEGGLRGYGIFNDSHSYVYVPKAYNDLIFSFIGETCGLVGSLGVILLLSVIACKILYNTHYVRDEQGKMICIGVFAMFSIQMVINLGMCLGILPVIGVTLPLFSSGGSSVLSMYMALGLVLGIYRRAQQTLFFERAD